MRQARPPKLVFAVATASVTMPGGWTMMIYQGTHWLETDPLVVRRPEMFTEDHRTGLCSSIPLEPIAVEELRG